MLNVNDMCLLLLLCTILEYFGNLQLKSDVKKSNTPDEVKSDLSYQLLKKEDDHKLPLVRYISGQAAGIYDIPNGKT